MMPQVFFNTDTFKPDSFPKFAWMDYCDLSIRISEERHEMARKLEQKHLMHRIPGFFEALRDNFEGWHLHHITGESVPMSVLVEKRLYEKRPWWELRFMREADHRRIHGDPDIFLAEYYGM